jgi:hypothetical protein
MDLLRVIAVALVACSAAGADPPAPPSRVAHPEGWKQLPAVATAVGTAARAEGVTIDAVDAWGEPAHGCYAVWLALHGGTRDAPALADQVLAGVARAAASRDGAASARGARSRDAAAGWREEIAIREVVKPTDPSGALAFAFTSPPYHGRVRARLGKGRISAVACFANEREPLACDATCAQLLEAAP